MKITKKKLEKAGWMFGSDEGSIAFVNLINKTLKTKKDKKHFLELFNKTEEKGTLYIKHKN